MSRPCLGVAALPKGRGTLHVLRDPFRALLWLQARSSSAWAGRDLRTRLPRETRRQSIARACRAVYCQHAGTKPRHPASLAAAGALDRDALLTGGGARTGDEGASPVRARSAEPRRQGGWACPQRLLGGGGSWLGSRCGLPKADTISHPPTSSVGGRRAPLALSPLPPPPSLPGHLWEGRACPSGQDAQQIVLPLTLQGACGWASLPSWASQTPRAPPRPGP